MNTRRTTLLIAIILAIGTGWLTYSYVSGLRSAGGQPQQVLVATADIPARSKITDSMFRAESRPSSALQPDTITDPSKAVGGIALVTIPSGSQLTASQVGNASELALPVRLEPGFRAVTIPIDPIKGVAGLIQPGDRVDVIAIPPKVGDTPPMAVTILRGIRVLALGNSLESPSATPSPQEQGANNVTLEVNPKQANTLAWADADATLRLALRSPKESIRSEPPEQLTFGSTAPISLPAPAPVPAITAMSPLGTAPAPTRRSAPYSPVQVIVGDQIAGGGSN